MSAAGSSNTPTLAILLAVLLPLAATLIGCGGDDHSPPSTSASDSTGQASTWQSFDGDELLEWRPLESRDPAHVAADSPPPATRFTRLDAASLGLTFRHTWADVPPDRFLDKGEPYAGGGVAVGDYDGDGLPDLYLTRPFGGGRLYRNLGAMRFDDVTGRAGFTDEATWGTGCSFIDIDNDGDLDLFVCAYDSPNRLWVNDGAGRYNERAADFSLDFRGASITMAFADYDLDGDLDGYLVTTRLRPTQDIRPRLEADSAGRPAVPADQRELFGVLPMPDGKYILHDRVGARDLLYRNNGDGSFTEVAERSGIAGFGKGLAAIWYDYDNDHHPDLYVSNDFYAPDHLYRNNGDGTFTDRIADYTPRTAWFSMGSDIGDVNNDGLADLLASDMAGSTHYLRMVGLGNEYDRLAAVRAAAPQQFMRNALYLGTAAPRSIEAATLLGIAETDWTWSVRFGDLDNDGFQDLFVSNGMAADEFHTDHATAARAAPGRYLDNIPPKLDANFAFRNRGDLEFEDAGEAWGLAERGMGYGAAMADLDNDGDLDILVNNFNAPPSLLRNESAAGHRVKVSLIGTRSNRRALGAELRLWTDAPGVQSRYVTVARGFQSGDDAVAHFGLGPHDRITRLTVRWPSGVVSDFADLPADRWYRITEPPEIGRGSVAEQPPATPPLRCDDSIAIPFTHRDTDFDDTAVQPLLPESLSRLGPPLAIGDLNGDGIDDVILGGGAGQPVAVLLHDGRGAFRPAPSPALDADAAGESSALALFDADGDGDLDLYVGRGTFEFPRNDDRQADSLYLNDGTGLFVASPPGSLPRIDMLTAAVVTADVDADGDADLFIGARAIVARYPAPPRHRLLLNDGAGRFTDAPADLNPWLTDAGMVTAAAFADLNADRHPDLILAHDYGPVRILLSDGDARFTDHTAASPFTGQAAPDLSQLTGRWRSLAAADLDGDGDIDLAVGNQGLNEPRAAHDGRRRALFLGDFESLGRERLVEAYAEPGGPWLPLRGRPEMVDAMPFLAALAPDYHTYADSTLADLVGQPALDSALSVTAVTYESGILLNDGSARFNFHPFPRIAQTAPVNAILPLDINDDGRPDLILAQNIPHTHRTTPSQDSGLGLVLLNDPATEVAADSPAGPTPFRPLWPQESGLYLPGPHTALSAIDLDTDGRQDLLSPANGGAPVVHLRR